MLRTGLGREVSALVNTFAADVHESRSYGNVGSFDTDGITITRGLRGVDPGRMTAGVTKAHVTRLQDELFNMGFDLEWKPVEALLFHALGHYRGQCACVNVELPNVDMSKAKHFRRIRRREYLRLKKRESRLLFIDRP